MRRAYFVVLHNHTVAKLSDLRNMFVREVLLLYASVVLQVLKINTEWQTGEGGIQVYLTRNI